MKSYKSCTDCDWKWITWLTVTGIDERKCNDHIEMGRGIMNEHDIDKTKERKNAEWEWSDNEKNDEVIMTIMTWEMSLVTM